MAGKPVSEQIDYELRGLDSMTNSASMREWTRQLGSDQ